MGIHDKRRISRLTSMITYLQTKSLVTAADLATRYSVSVRTVYRDIRALEEAGVPLYVEEGKGYKIVEDYRLPPVMFTENEANALIAAEQIVLNTTDSSLVQEYSRATEKIKAALSGNMKENVQFLSRRMVHTHLFDLERTSSFLSLLQYALTHFQLVRMNYSDVTGNRTERTVEPFSLLSTRGNWLLVAFCRLRGDFRYFRLDRIFDMEVLQQNFLAHDMTLEDFFEKYA